MDKWKALLLILLLGVSVISVTLFFKTGRVVYDPSEIIESMPGDVDMQFSGVNYTEVSNGRREWTVQADTLHYFRSDNVFVFDKVAITFFAGEGPVHVSGDEARYEKDEQMVRLIGAVTAEDSKGRRLSAGEIQYDMEMRTAYAPGRFEYSGPDFSLDGAGLTLWLEDNRMMVLEDANLTITSLEALL